MQPISIYLIIYILPTFLLIALSTYVITYNNKALENRLIFIILLLFGTMLFGEFLRHVAAFEWNPFITMYIVGLSVVASMATLIYLVYIVVQKQCPSQLRPIPPAIFYSIVPLHFIIILFGGKLTITDFQKRGIWIHRTESLYNIWIYGAVGVTATLTLAICLYGWLHSKSQRSKQLLRFLAISNAVIYVTFIFAMSLVNTEHIPPSPTFLLLFIISVILAISITHFDITPNVQQRYKALFELTPSSIILLNEQLEILEINNQAKQFLHHEENESSIHLWHTRFNKKQSLTLIKELKNTKQLVQYPLEFEHPMTQQKVTLLFNATLISFHNSQKYYVMWQDITPEIEQQKMVHHLAYHDALTGLYNRTSFVNAVETKLTTQTEHMHAFVLIDLNFFKQINDTHGHLVGDEVLKFVATMLVNILPENALIARLGGDEFVIFYEQLQHEEQLLHSLQTIRTFFNETPFCYDNWTQIISLSIGYSHFPKDGTNFKALYHYADMAMYHDKMTIKRNIHS